MTEATDPQSQSELEALRARVRKLERINEALMARVERSLDEQGDAFAVFQTAILLESRVKQRTAELDRLAAAAEASNQELQAALVQAAEANETKSRFLATVSHELRTPLNGVLGMAELLEGDPLPPESQERVATLRASATVLLRLLDDILDLAKIEAGGVEITMQPFALREALRYTVDLFAANAASKGLELALHLGSRVPSHCVGDAPRLRQIVSNLVGNAVKFTQRGAVVVRVDAVDRASGLGLRIQVQDDGEGIPRSALPKLFEPFYQVDSSNTRRHGGTGLGLAISRQLATLLGGSLSVESELGVGSCFQLDLPLFPVDTARIPRAAIVAAPTAPAPLLRPDGLRPLVLVVDDNPVNLKVASMFLRRLGCDTEEVADGQAALHACEARNYDVLLLDRHMPGLDGCEVARELRRRGYAAPILALTASAMAADREACLSAGMDGFLTKPIALADLRAGLERALACGSADARGAQP